MRLFKGRIDAPPRKKDSCLGSLFKLIILFLLLGVGILLFLAIVSPWAFFLGGKFRVLPYWEGWGRLHSKISGDYVLFVYFEPDPAGRMGTYVDGIGYVCTPRGEKIRLTLIGSMRKHLNVSTDGEKMYIKVYHRPIGGFSGERRPRIELLGHWKGPNLVMNDDGSISRSFQPDGSVYLGNDPNRPYRLEVIPITLTEGSYSEFESACTAAHH